jgi:ribonuclease HII
MRLASFDALYPGPLLGLDEVGTGCIAGPIFVGAVISPTDTDIIKGLGRMRARDSKDMTPEMRKRVYDYLVEKNVRFDTACMETFKLSRHRNWDGVTRLFRRLVIRFKRSDQKIKTVLVDGQPREIGYPYTSLLKGDAKSLAIALASIVAKTERDIYMSQLGEEYPAYEWGRNKGYFTEDHKKALYELGPTPHHRMWTKPVIAALQQRQVEGS